MTTPLTTREIVWGKWWGTFAMVPRLAILPIWVSAGEAMVTDGGIGLVLMIGLILAYSAAITSLGLAAATWIPRLDRVITVSVLTFLIVSAGWPLVVNLLRVFPPTDEGLVVASPFFGVYATTEWAASSHLEPTATRGGAMARSWPTTRHGLSSGLASTSRSPCSLP